ncbi:MAG TPA: WGxxGxxG family protein [Bryobacteraceae bacterium]|nr:WGxxGxxG family protein [Bryobacteraceae bacterium]
MKRLIASAFMAMGLVAGGVCQIASAQNQSDAAPYTYGQSSNMPNYGEQRVYRGGRGGYWGLLGLCGLFGLLGSRRARIADTTGRIQGTWEPRPTH